MVFYTAASSKLRLEIWRPFVMPLITSLKGIMSAGPDRDVTVEYLTRSWSLGSRLFKISIDPDYKYSMFSESHFA